ncbi:GGDEF domain-containing protein [Paenibacillus taiwanensis]|uniref:GGDEF domain-containing protein n=1 Tax=Paenibacillus taiwanensis TaxID=401638 RepID=UPI0003F7CDAA|nr:GGDEF domain-containing protein [Paenibacillus taiwanensis]
MKEVLHFLLTERDVVALTTMCLLYIMLIMLLMSVRLYSKQRSSAYVILFAGIVMMIVDRTIALLDFSLQERTLQLLSISRAALVTLSFIFVNIAVLRLYKRINRPMRLRFILMIVGVPLVSVIAALIAAPEQNVLTSTWPLIAYQAVIAVLCYVLIAPRISQQGRYTFSLVVHLGILLTITLNITLTNGTSSSLLMTQHVVTLCYYTILFFLFFERIVENLQTTYRSSITDGLTGLYNRRYMHQRMNQFIAGKPKQVSLIFCDIDNFKRLNDTKGHLFADEVLKTVAQIVREEVEDIGLAGRFGGEEIIAFIAQRKAKPSVIAESIRSRIEAEAGVTISIGYSVLRPKMSIDQLVKEADEAMYYSKQNGKNRVSFYGEIKHFLSPIKHIK